MLVLEEELDVLERLELGRGPCPLIQAQSWGLKPYLASGGLPNGGRGLPSGSSWEHLTQLPMVKNWITVWL